MNQPIKGYTVYIISPNKSCLFYFGIDGTNKKKVLKLAKGIAKMVEDYYNTEMWKVGELSATVEEYKPNQSPEK